MRVLTVQETEEVGGGALVPGAVVGASTGAMFYLYSAATSGQFSWGGLAFATGNGAGIGAIAGPVGITRVYFMSKAAAVGGAAYGIGI